MLHITTWETAGSFFSQLLAGWLAWWVGLAASDMLLAFAVWWWATELEEREERKAQITSQKESVHISMFHAMQLVERM